MEWLKSFSIPSTDIKLTKKVMLFPICFVWEDFGTKFITSDFIHDCFNNFHRHSGRVRDEYDHLRKQYAVIGDMQKNK